MPLFQHSVLKKYLADLPKEKLESAWERFKAHFQNPTIQQNILNSKEEEYQEGFLRDLFVNILGYTLKPQPNFNLVLEKKSVSDATKSDGAILSSEGAVIAVIELKDTGTPDLDRVEKQAFGYKHQHKDCRYVITANFQKLRLYISDAIDSETFDLFQLSKESFALMYCCLEQSAFQNDVPLKMKQQSIAEEENVTKKLYADYSRFRKKLFGDIMVRNPQYNKLILFKKTQKLLDRFLFVLFAEDRLLVPANSVREILSQWETLKEIDQYVPLYERFRKFFGYLNTGYTRNRYEIYPYNGGLFAPDEILDSILIEDQLLYDSCVSLSNYDFESEVDVNILGHIFEHSLAEIEKIEQELASGPSVIEDPEAVYKSKRKKDGVFYTPRYITKYIVENTVGSLCTQKKEELDIISEDFVPQKGKRKEMLLHKLEVYRQWLLQLTICDPACGSGAFLNQALEFLIAEHGIIDSLQARVFGVPMISSDVETSILENNLYGVDINEEATDIAKLSLWLRTARKGRKLNDLNQHIKCGNSLIDDPAVAGDLAFDWHNEFPEVFANGGFDVVIGNPPYVRQELLSEFKDYFSKFYQVFNPSSDLFAYFYELGIRILKRAGYFSFISNTFDKTTAGRSLRNYLRNNISIKKYIDFTSVQVFEGTTTYPIILICINNPITADRHKIRYKKIPPKSNPATEIYYTVENLVDQSTLNEGSWDFKSDDGITLLEKIKSNQPIKTVFGKCYYGIKTGFNEAFIISEKEKMEILSFSPNDKNVIKPFYEGRDLSKWNTPVVDKYIIFTRRGVNINLYPGVFKRLLKYRNKLEPKNDHGMTDGRKPGSYKWYEIQDTVDYYKLFEKPKIVWNNLQSKNKFCWDDKGYYINAPCVILPAESKTLLGIINSKLIWFFLTSISVVRSGGFIEVKPQYFEQIPVPPVNSVMEISMIELVDSIINLTKEYQDLTQQFSQLLHGKYEHLNFNKKIQDWPTLTSQEFLKELDKQKLKLTLPAQSEWILYFESEKAKAIAIQDLIKKTDKQIDAMVYELYGLTEEEVRVVEGES